VALLPGPLTLVRLKGVFVGCLLFLQTHFFFYERAQLASYELTHVRASPGDCAATVRLAGRKSGTQDLRALTSEALAEQPAVARTAVELHACCARVSLAAALLSQHIDGVARAGVAQAPRAGRARARLVLLTRVACWRP
jgi:hypothetical protein